MKKAIILIVLSLIPSVIIPTISQAREQIRIVGSSTVFPFISATAEEFANTTKYKSPIVESTGTGGGIKLFCSGIGDKYPDFANASRDMKKSEFELCKKNGVTKIAEIKIGYDGIVIANSQKALPISLNKEQIFLGLAKRIEQNGVLIKNPNKTWSDVHPLLPDVEIRVYGPPPTSGTRDAFVELVMHEACGLFPAFKDTFKDKKEYKKECGMMREDGYFIEAGENDNLIIQKLVANPNSLGIFGFSFLEQNEDKVRGNKVDGIEPTFENIASELYGISRSLFVYVKKQHYETIAGMEEFVELLLSEEAIGLEGFLTYKGLIPMSNDEREDLVKRIASFDFAPCVGDD